MGICSRNGIQGDEEESNHKRFIKVIIYLAMSATYSVFDVTCVYCGETKIGVLLKPGTLHRVICPKCRRAMYVKILEDLSIHTYTEDEVCPECHGTRFVTCPKCGGYGIIVIARKSDYESSSVFKLSEIPDWCIISLAKTAFVAGCPQCGGGGSVVENYVSCNQLLKLAFEKGGVVKGRGEVVCGKCGGRGFINVGDKTKIFR